MPKVLPAHGLISGGPEMRWERPSLTRHLCMGVPAECKSMLQRKPLPEEELLAARMLEAFRCYACQYL